MTHNGETVSESEFFGGKVHTVTYETGGKEVTLETGRVARQANGAVVASCGGTVVLAAVTAARSARPGQDFFPLTVNYQERMYASGRIPGSFFRREGRPSEKETLTCRLIDRPIRPLFPAGFLNEVQVVVTVLSAEPGVDPDILGMVSASAALSVSGVPFAGPIGAARVGYQGDAYVLNPSLEQTAQSQLDMVVAGTADAVLMVESEAKELSEDLMLGAVLFAHQEMQKDIAAIGQLCEMAQPQAWEMPDAPDTSRLDNALAELVREELEQAYQVTDKQQRQSAVAAARSRAQETLPDEAAEITAEDVSGAFKRLEKGIVRGRILAGQPRIDGRTTEQVRPIEPQVGVLPGAHGSALFTRGETQAVVTATLAPPRSAALVEGLEGTENDTFMLHYNFPPFSVGETGFMGGPKRREIGHGRLARRALEAVLPSHEDFAYTVRVVSDITESNGSSSMASVCGGSMALMDAGVPVRAPVAGVAMGLVLDGSDFAVLTDILGDEDHLGDMDFKVAGTEKGVTALQMDIKIQGITQEIMDQALRQAHAGRMHILAEMARAISSSRPELPENAPKSVLVEIPKDRIASLIGKGGGTIRAIQAESGADIEIGDDGEVKVFAATSAARDLALKRIKEATSDPEIGEVYEGEVNSITDFGAFVALGGGRDGLVHISEIANERVSSVADHLREGQVVKVKVIEVDERGRVRLSMRALLPGYEERRPPSRRAAPDGGGRPGGPPRRRPDGDRRFPPRRNGGGDRDRRPRRD